MWREKLILKTLEVAAAEEGDTIEVTVPRMEVGDTVVQEEVEVAAGGCAAVHHVLEAEVVTGE